MTQEEKAKAYDEAIRKLRGMMPNWERLSYNGKTFLQDLIHIFPELAESEDERIRKAIVSFLKSPFVNENITDEKVAPWLAWLEKQGEQSNKMNSCKITFEDVLALECSMKTAKITKGGDELYEILVPLYNKIHNAYLAEKQGKQKAIETTWKPSKEQMKALDSVIDEYDGYPEFGSLVSLKNDLKKL